MTSAVINCPVCGAPMNHHANKMVYQSREPAEATPGEALEEFYHCPGCGAGVSRPAPLEA